MKKLLFILPVIAVGLLLSSSLALAADNPTISGTITYDNYASGDIIVAFLDDEPGDSGTQVVGYDTFSGPGAYSVTFNQSFSGEATVLAWNDINGDQSPQGDTESIHFSTYEVDGDGTRDITLALGGDPWPDGEVVILSGEITYDDYESGNIIIMLTEDDLFDESGGANIAGKYGDSFKTAGGDVEAAIVTLSAGGPNILFTATGNVDYPEDVDGIYTVSGTHNGENLYVNGTYYIFWDEGADGGDQDGEWDLSDSAGGDEYLYRDDDDVLGVWISDGEGDDDGPEGMIDMDSINGPGEYDFEIDEEYDEETIFLLAWNDVDGDEMPTKGEAYHTSAVDIDGDTEYDFELDDEFEEDIGEGEGEEYEISGVVEYDNYVSGPVIIVIADCDLDDEDCEPMDVDVRTASLGEYSVDFADEDAGDIYILAFNDVDHSNKLSDGEAYHEAWIEAEDDIFYNITLGLDGGSGEILDLDRYSIHGILTYDDWDSGVCVVQVYEPGEFEDGEGDEVDYDVLMSGSGEYELSLDLGMHGQIQLFALCDTNDNDELDEGEPVHYVVLTVEDDYEYNFSLDRSWVSGMQPVVVSPLEEEGGFLAVMPAAAGGPNVRVLYEDGSQYSTFFAYNENLRGGFNVLLEDMNNDGEDEVITWTNQGFGPDVRIFTLEGELIDRLMVYDDNFRGGVNLVVGNFDKDENMEFAVVPQNGSSNLRVYDYVDQKIELLDWTMVYNLTFKGGMNITTEDFDGDDYDEIAVAPASGGGPNVQVFDYDNKELAVMGVFFAYDKKFHGGVLLESVELDGDKMLVTAPFKHGGPNIRVYKYVGGTFELVDWFMAFDESFRGELSLSSGELDEYDNDEIVIAPKSDGGPNVRIYEYEDETGEYQLLDWFMAYDEDFRGGVNVMCTDIDGDNFDEIVTAPASGAPNVRVYDVDSGEAELNTWFWAFAQSFKGGVNL